MIVEKLRVNNCLGIHARPAGMIVDITGKADCEATISYDGVEANAKSILNVMMLAVPPDAEVKFMLKGNDEKDVALKLEKLFNGKFDEI